MTCHQYQNSALLSQKSFGRETNVSVTKCRLFSQAIGLVDPVPNLHDGLVKFVREFSYRRTVINPAHQKCFGG